MVDRAVPCSMLESGREVAFVWHRPRSGRSTLAFTLFLTRARPARVVSRPLARICPSSNYHAQGCARALYGSPFRTRPRSPIRNLTDRRWLLPHPERDCKNQSPLAHRRESQTQPCSSRNQETGSASAHPSRLFGGYLWAPAIRFDTASDKDVAVRRSEERRVGKEGKCW